MLKLERHTKILELLRERKYMSISEIAGKLNVSGMTVRRDVHELGDANKLVRLYGGAQNLELKEKELTTDEKISLHQEQKEYIGLLMNQLIKDNDVVYLGAGTTILYSLKNITKKDLFIVTNSLISFNYLIKETEYHVLLTGGDFSKVTEEFIGEHAEKTFESINIDIAFAATNGIYKNNVTTSNHLEGSIQRKAFEHSKTKVVVADSTKFNASDIYTFYKISDLDYLITDNKIKDTVYSYYSEFGKILK